MFFLDMPKISKRKTRADLGKSYRVTKIEYEQLDDIELLCEVCFLIQCKKIDRCCACRKLLRFCLKMLINRWDEIRFINFFDALKLIKEHKNYFSTASFVLYWYDRKSTVRNLIREGRVKKDIADKSVLDKYQYLFYDSIDIYSIMIDQIRLLVTNTDFIFYIIYF